MILGGTTSLSNVLGSAIGASMASSGIPGSTTLGNWLAGAGATDPIMPELDGTSAGAIKTSGLEDLPIRRESDKGVSVEVRLVMNTGILHLCLHGCQKTHEYLQKEGLVKIVILLHL